MIAAGAAAGRATPEAIMSRKSESFFECDIVEIVTNGGNCSGIQFNEDKPFNGSPDFYQTYTYERWGNRTVNAGGTWDAPTPQYMASATTNRPSQPAGYTMTYDAAGNLNSARRN